MNDTTKKYTFTISLETKNADEFGSCLTIELFDSKNIHKDFIKALENLIKEEKINVTDLKIEEHKEN